MHGFYKNNNNVFKELGFFFFVFRLVCVFSFVSARPVSINSSQLAKDVIYFLSFMAIMARTAAAAAPAFMILDCAFLALASSRASMAFLPMRLQRDIAWL